MSGCRICGCRLPAEPLIAFDGMPAKAQHLPDVDELLADRPIRLEVCQCPGCGVVQLANPPVSYYREVIRAAAFSPEMRKFRLRQFAGWVAKHGLTAKKVLEVGCGRGEYLELMRSAGADVYGMEHNAEAADFCRRRGLKVHCTYIGDGEGGLPDGPFDGFFILNFLEHLPDLPTVLNRLAENLTPGGVGLVEVPNFDMMLREKLFVEFTSDHLFYFTADSLRNTLSHCGFEVTECREIWHDYIISAEVRKRKNHDLSELAVWRQNLAGEMNAFIERYGKVAVWGAGHQALAVLALAELGGRICYIIDSAPFKQGKFSPATHIPIVPPGRLASEPPAAVMVMAAGYSDEVAAILRNEFRFAGPIGILRGNRLEPGN